MSCQRRGRIVVHSREEAELIDVGRFRFRESACPGRQVGMRSWPEQYAKRCTTEQDELILSQPAQLCLEFADPGSIIVMPAPAKVVGDDIGKDGDNHRHDQVVVKPRALVAVDGEARDYRVVFEDTICSKLFKGMDGIGRSDQAPRSPGNNLEKRKQQRHDGNYIEYHRLEQFVFH